MKQPTSETGISTLNSRVSLLQRGFTLWELLVVVAIIAITVSLTQLSTGLVDNNRDLKGLGKDLGKMFHLLNQEAVFESRNFAISVNDEGFEVLEYNGEKWLPTSDNFFTRIKFNKEQRSQLIINDLVIDTSKRERPVPHIYILSSGEMSAFEWHISDRNTQSGIVLEGNLLGSVLMTGPEPLG